MSHALSRAASFESCCSDSVVAGMMFSFRVHSFHFMGGRSARPRNPSMDPSLDPNQNALASFCRETPGFMLACVSSPIKLGTTDDRCRVSPSVLTRFLSRFHEPPVGRHVVVMTCGGLFPR